jgi:hypothetical protein
MKAANFLFSSVLFCASAATVSFIHAASPSPPAPAPHPAPEMQSVEKALSGTWAVEDTFAPMGDNADKINTAKGGTGHGVQVWRSGPGGFTFMEEERNVTPAGEVYIVGYMWWDATKKAFGGMECNSQWPQGCDPKSSLSRVALSWDGKQLVVDFKSEKDPSKIVWHEVFSEITPTTFLQTADVAQPDGTLKRWLTIHARRTAPAESNAEAGPSHQ